MLLPKHVAIIMDGNGRWARAQGLKNSAGHKAGIEPLRNIIALSAAKGIQALTVFAFSSENWQRPDDEVSTLMNIFVESLTNEIDELHAKSVQLRIIGKREQFEQDLIERMVYCEQLTSKNKGLIFTIAVDYGGRWDIVNASKRLAQQVVEGKLSAAEIDETVFSRYLCNHDLPDPDLCIRTGGEYRISNFLLWQFAYTEFVVSDCLWPDFDSAAYEQALQEYTQRDRRFGQSK